MTLVATRSRVLENDLATNWYVVQTQVKREQEVKFGLLKKGYEVFFPRYKKMNKTGEVLLPLFSGYLFAKFDASVDGWQEISRVIGVSKILGYDSETNTLAAVRGNVIPGLQAFCDDLDVVDMALAFPLRDPGVGADKREYARGDQVEILNGMFKGQQATYWNSSKLGTHIILSLLNRPVRVILKSEEIR